jgi:hypothetical protein
MIGSVLIIAGLFVANMGASQYFQYSIQESQFGDCYDYSSGNAVQVSCAQQERDSLLYFALSAGLIGGGGFVIVKGIKGKWDQNVKSGEMVGPKRG